MAILRSYDAFAKPLDGVRTKSVSGGAITLLASTTAALLLVSQLYLYARLETRHSMHLAESVPNAASSAFFALDGSANAKHGGPGGLETVSATQRRDRHLTIPLRVHVTFPHVTCRDLDYAHDGASASSGQFAQLHGARAFAKRLPTMTELRKALPGETVDSRHRDRGCTVEGTIRIPRVGGSISVTVSQRAWTAATAFFVLGGALDHMGQPRQQLPNVTHYVHDVSFGEPFPLGEHPLRDVLDVVDNESGVALANLAVKLVPTKYDRPSFSPIGWFLGGRKRRNTYQMSVARHIVQPQTLAAQRSTMLPGLAVGYDFTPLAVRHVERRENPLVFLSSLVSIVGGVFVTVGLVTGCLVNSAAAVAKKID